MSSAAETVFLFDVDNTLLNNDRIQDDLREELTRAHGDSACERYWAIFEALRSELGYADYLGALERLRIERLHDPTLLPTANWLIDYPFAERLYPHALQVVEYVRQWGQAVILSDGDAIFQPRKIARSGLWDAFAGNVLVYVHKENELADVERGIRPPITPRRRQGSHPRRGQGDLGRSGHDHLPEAGALRRAGAPARWGVR